MGSRTKPCQAPKLRRHGRQLPGPKRILPRHGDTGRRRSGRSPVVLTAAL